MATATATLSHPLFGSMTSRRNYSTVRSASVLGGLERKIEEEIEESILRSRYMQRIEVLHSLVLQTEALSRLEPNWNSYGAEPPQMQAIRSAIEFLPLAARADVLPTRSLPSAEGGIAFRFTSDDKRALVEFLNTGAIEVMLYNAAGILNPEPEELGDPQGILQAVQAHLMR